MIKHIYLILFSLVFSLTFVTIDDTSGQSLRILPLGNSITEGYDDSAPPEGNRIAYRSALYTLLNDGGYSFDFVGHGWDGFDIFPDANHAGMPGATGQNIVTLLRNGLDVQGGDDTTFGQPYLDDFTADIILLHIGTNDIIPTGDDASAITDILNEIDLWEAANSHHITVFVARIINQVPYNSIITDYNDNLELIVNGRLDPSIILVDMQDSAQIDYGLDMLGDGYHPNDVGYTKMGQEWFDEIDAYISALPGAPGGLLLNGETSSSIDLSWSDNSGDETGFEIWRSSSASGPFTLITTRPPNSESFTNTSLSEGTEYFYRVNAVNLTGPSTFISASTSTLTDPPVAPSFLAAGLVTHTSIPLTWVDVATNETNYVVQRSSSAGSGYSNLQVLPANSTSFTDNFLPENTTYYYRVYARNSGGNSGYSNIVSASTLLSVPDAPSGLSTGTVTTSSIAISWSDHSDNESGFEIERSLTSGGDFSWIYTTSPDVTSYTNSGLADNVTYFYRVRATNDAGNSGYTAETSATTSLARPVAPSSLVVDAVTSSTVQISWNDNSATETGFEVQRSENFFGGYGLIHTTTSDVTTYIDDTVEDNTRYYYRVRAINGAGESSYTSSVSAFTPLAVPDDPTALNVSGTSTSSITLTWNDQSDNELGFRIERSDQSGTGFSVIHTTTTDVTTYTNIGLLDNTQYFYRIRAYNSAGTSGYTAEANGTTQLAVPSAPSALALNNITHNSMRLTWTDNSHNESAFEIERSSPTGTDFEQITLTAADETSYFNIGLEENTIYFYRLRAINASGNSPYSNVVSASTLMLVPPDPSNLVLSNVTVSSIDLTWVDNSTTESGFVIQRSLLFDSGYEDIITTGPDVTSYTDLGLDDNQEYFYRVRAVNTTGTSGYTSASATTLLDVPAAPTVLAGVATSVCAIDLSWTDNADSEDGFLIERSSSVFGVYSPVGTTLANVNVFTDLTTENSTRYYYRVLAFNSAGNSATSSITSVIVNIVLEGGTIGLNQTICPSGDPEEILNIVSPSGGGGAWIYQWQSRIPSGIFLDITGATGLSYDPPPGLIETREYQRVATTDCGIVLSNIVTIAVEDIEAPVFTYCPNDTSIFIDRNLASEMVLPSNPISVDNCGLITQTWTLTGATIASSPSTGINFVGNMVFNLGITTVRYQAFDFAGNMTECAFNVNVEKKIPEVLGISVPNEIMKIGDVISATIEVANDGGSVYTLLSGDIGGYPLLDFVRINNTTYLANIIIIEGGNSYEALVDIPVGNVLVSDGITPSLPYAIPISQDNDLLDALRPVIISAVLVEGQYKIGDEVVIDIQTDGISYMINPASTVNGISVTEPNMRFIELGLGYYQLIYRVVEGDVDIALGEFEASLIFDKPSGNIGLPYTILGNIDKVEIDANAPVVERIEVPDEEVGVGGIVVVTVTGDSTGYTVAPGTFINGVPISSDRVEFAEISNGLYALTYEVSASDNVVEPGMLEMSIILEDLFGNVGEAFDLIEENELEIYNQLPSTHMVALPEICEGEQAEIIVYLIGREPFSIELFDGTSTLLIEDINTSPYSVLVSPLETTTYSIPLITDRNGVENTGGSVKISVNASSPVSITNLQSGYSVETPPFKLTADTPGGDFTGPGVSASDYFSPALADTVNSPHTIYYTYANPNGCESVDSALVFVLGAEGDIYIPSSMVCDNSDPFMATASNIAGVIGSFTLNNSQGSEVTGIVDNGDNTATIDPARLSGGIYTIKYAYFDAVMLYIRKEFELIYLTQPEILSPSENTSFCKNEEKVQLLANDAEAYFYGQGVTGNVDEGFYFDPAAAPVGDISISCYIYSDAACEKSTSMDLRVNGASEAKFTVNSTCLPEGGGLISFNNQSTSKLTVETWRWDFGDPLSGADNYSDEVDPEHFYPYPGEWSISLSATTYKGCVSSFQIDTVFSSSPISDFTWISDCFMDNQGVEFVNLTPGLASDESMKWIFMSESGDVFDEVISESNTIEYQFPNASSYLVGLETMNQGACADTTIKSIELRPTYKLNSDGYLETFDSDEGGWTIESEDENSSWVWGSPDFEGFTPDGEGNSWYTELENYSPGYVENSWIQSPCFDFSDLDRPMINLDIMRSFIPNVNGSVLQYLDVRDEGWKTVGADSEGINWYNSFNIYNKPGGSPVGWGLDVFYPDTAWVETTHDLSFLKDKQMVSLRLAMASSGSQGIGNQGFAFDNLMISEKTKLAVLEYFTNSSDEDSFYADIYVDSFASVNISEVVNLQYHTDYPGDDPMNQNNPGMVETRAINLKVGMVPYAVLDGGASSSQNYDFSSIENSPGTEDIDLLSLEIPSFDIDLEVDWTESDLTAYTTVTCEVESYSENIQLFVVVFESVVTTYEGTNGDTEFRNVALEILPNSGGKLLGQNWYQGLSMDLTNQWTFKPYVEDVADLVVVAFVQDRNTKEILQAAANYKTPLTGIQDRFAKARELQIYPNPAKDYLYVNLGSRSEKTGDLEVYDLSGRMVLNLQTPPGYQIFNMDIQQLTRGMYIIRRFESGELVGTNKFIKTE